MNEDDRFDAWLRGAAREYHRAPGVPRDEMWGAIEQGIRPVRIAVGGQTRRPLVRVLPWLLAAGALLAVGLELGRRLPRPGDLTTARSAAVASEAEEPSSAYAAAATAHLGRAEALLTTLRSSPGQDASIGRWARDLLSDTRLLLDSPAGQDPRRRLLLEDLELVLAQIVQLDAAATSDDRSIVRRSIERGELLTRLRTAVPSGAGGWRPET